MTEPKIQIIENDILEATDYLIGHCCNCQNTMNSGVAKALRNRFPEVYMADCSAFNQLGKDQLLGRVEIVSVETRPEETEIEYIANIYGQLRYGNDGQRYMNYEAVYEGLRWLGRMTAPSGNSVGFPWMFGSNRAGGNWKIVIEMIRDAFSTENTEPRVVNLYKV